jgi:uncharacterized protein (DUF924 family)
MQWTDIIHFWFEECKPSQWFVKDESFDALVRDRFLLAYENARSGVTAKWRSAPEGRLAEILLLDQFSRNMFRGTPQAFATDALALTLAEDAVRVGDDIKLPLHMRHFIYMPFMHSESKEVHAKALTLFEKLGDQSALRYEIIHKDIIDRFGRYPSRNDILGRSSSSEEMKFLETHSGF